MIHLHSENDCIEVPGDGNVDSDESTAPKIKFLCVGLMYDRCVKFAMYLSYPLQWIVQILL